jgi:hypothetical protein
METKLTHGCHGSPVTFFTDRKMKSYLNPLTELLRRSALVSEETSQQIKATALSEVDVTVITFQESLVEPSVEDPHLIRKQQTLNQLTSNILARNSSSHRLNSPTRSVEKKITRHSVTSSIQFNGDYLPIQSSIETKEDDLNSVAFVGLETCQSEPKWLPLHC